MCACVLAALKLEGMNTKYILVYLCPVVVSVGNNNHSIEGTCRFAPSFKTVLVLGSLVVTFQTYPMLTSKLSPVFLISLIDLSVPYVGIFVVDRNTIFFTYTHFSLYIIFYESHMCCVASIGDENVQDSSRAFLYSTFLMYLPLIYALIP